MGFRTSSRAAGVTAATVAALVAGAALVGAGVPGASAATCSDVEVVFARGSGEAPGLGVLGAPLVRNLSAALAGTSVSSYAVDYAASLDQTSAGPGSRNLVDHVVATAAACPGTRVVLGGYSQGATVVDLALGIRVGLTSGTALPSSVTGRVAAVVVFGNPLGMTGATIARSAPAFAARTKEYCASGDSVCGGNGTWSGSHLSYATNGAVPDAAAFAAGLVRAGGPGPTTSPTPAPTTPTPTTPTPTSPTPTPTVASCVTASTSAHVGAGRARAWLGRAYAVGTYQRLGVVSDTVVVSLAKVARGWTLVSSCRTA